MTDHFLPLNDPVFIRPGICHACVHQHRNNVTCTAFPDGIPEVIVFGDVTHTVPFPGDNGVQFKAKIL